jgi:hypothetical protein
VEAGGDPGFELLLLLLFEGGAVASEGGGGLAVFEPPPGPAACPPEPCTGPLGTGAAGPDADCELLGVEGELPDDGFWPRASAYALGIPDNNSAIANSSRTSRNIASAVKKKVA